MELINTLIKAHAPYLTISKNQIIKNGQKQIGYYKINAGQLRLYAATLSYYYRPEDTIVVDITNPGVHEFYMNLKNTIDLNNPKEQIELKIHFWLKEIIKFHK